MAVKFDTMTVGANGNWYSYQGGGLIKIRINDNMLCYVWMMAKGRSANANNIAKWEVDIED